MRSLACLLTLWFVFFSCGAIKAAERLALAHGRIIDGTGANAIPDGIILVEDGRISALGRWGDVDVPPGAEVVDVKGKIVLPGIVDSHVHSSSPPAVRLAFLRAGVTTVCDLGSPIDCMPDFLKAFDGEDPVARGLRAGPIITTPGGLPDAIFHANLNFEVATLEEARAGVAHLAELGADVIKIYLEPSEEFGMLKIDHVKAVVKEARARGLLVRAHVSKLAALDIALEGGVDVIEHVPKPRLENVDIQKKLAGSLDPMKDLYDILVVPEYENVLPRIVEKGIILVPTLTRGLGQYYNNEKASEGQRVLAEGVLDIVRRFHELGGVVALGTDYYPKMQGAAGKMHLREIELLRAAGLTPMEVIEACTRNAARACGVGKELGTLERGKLADMVVIDGDPLSDLEALGNVAMVIKDGRIAYEAKG